MRVRFATFNVSLYRERAGELLTELDSGGSRQIRQVAEIIQRTRPDVLLLNEFDYSPAYRAVDAFRDQYLAVSQHGAQPLEYPYAYTAPVNTGVQTGFDLDRDGAVGGAADAHGFGLFPGQYGMVVLSRYPIEHARIRTFRYFRWKDMPDAMLPDDPNRPGEGDWYDAAVLDTLRLSSKSHWDVPIRFGGDTVHLLASHPAPPLFDGPEQRNRMHNHDEIRFWRDYVSPARGEYIYDDTGRYGGLDEGTAFVVAGDQNADPVDGFRMHGAINQLLDSPRVRDPRPGSAGAVLAALRQGPAGRIHIGNSFHHTSDFGDGMFGNMRLDYVLPSSDLVPRRHAVFWPVKGTPLERLNDASDHRLVWTDLSWR